MERWSSALVAMEESGETVTFRQIHGVRPWTSSDPSTQRVWWNDAGVHQNITFPVHPDPISGMHCWHQKVRLRPAEPHDRYADIHVDFARARAVYRKWLSVARPASGELRRPIWLFRPVKPVLDAYRLPEDAETLAARAAAAGERSSPFDFHALLDWTPAEVWGEIPAGTGRQDAQVGSLNGRRGRPPTRLADPAVREARHPEPRPSRPPLGARVRALIKSGHDG